MFGKREIRDEDRLRSQSLRQSPALQAATGASTLDALLESAEAILTLHWAKDPPDQRALELINKTNQFNLNGRRFTPPAWEQFLRDEASRLLVVDYSDRFGKLGKISVVAGCVRGETLHVSTWVLSCRAFSRRIEHQIMRILLEQWPRLEFEFERTDRNGPIADFLAGIGATRTIDRKAFADRCPPLFHKTVTFDE